MRNLHLTIMIFCQILLVSLLIYSNLVSTLPVSQEQISLKSEPKDPKGGVQNVAEAVSKPQLALSSVDKLEARSEQSAHIESPKTPVQSGPIEPVKESVAQEPKVLDSKLDARISPIIEPLAITEKKTLAIADSPHIEAKNYVKTVDSAVASNSPNLSVSKQDGVIIRQPASAAIPVAVPVIPLTQPVTIQENFVRPKESILEVPIVDKVSEVVANIQPAMALMAPSLESIPVELSRPVDEPVKATKEVKLAPEEPAKLQVTPIVPKEVVQESLASAVPTLNAKTSLPVIVPAPVVVTVPIASPPLTSSQSVEQRSISSGPTVVVVDKVAVDPVENVAAAPTVVIVTPVKSESTIATGKQKDKDVQQVASFNMASEEKLGNLSSPNTEPPVVKGGLGPLHLLATTLCNYQPEKLVSDETLNSLYCQRAMLRKSLFEFMSLKFTNLERLSSRLNPGLEVVPPKSIDSVKSGDIPSHGWPVVGKCTAHDLRLMAEAAWCEPSSTEELDKQQPKITSNKHQRADGSRHLEQPADESSVISKILQVVDVKNAPVVESSIASLNLTQQQLANIQAQTTGDQSRKCKLNALKLSKALFNHLAEDQTQKSESWPQIYAELYEDDCARKRVIDIITALSGYRSESTTIRRDNVEFAFAMDDLRAKVLESDVNSPLAFDRQFIEVEQFLQQSVKLMLANIDPGRAKLTSMRYRSLMPAPLSKDDHCVELHQRLMAKNHPTDCNPTQFGQLPDVLRMTASSLGLWSVEKELAKHSAKSQDSSLIGQEQPRRNVNECIAGLVAN